MSQKTIISRCTKIEGESEKDGKRLRKAKTKEEKTAMGYFERFTFNLKRLLKEDSFTCYE